MKSGQGRLEEEQGRISRGATPRLAAVGLPGQLTLLAAIAVTMVVPRAASAQVVAFDLVGSASQNLTSFTNPFNGAFVSAGDGFQKYQRGVSATIPFSVLDDSLVIFPTDNLGIVKDGNLDEFFGVVDTENPQNSGPVSATWTFDVSAASLGLVLSIDMGAMGDFESSDSFEWTYSIDGGPVSTAFASTVDQAASFTYVLEGGLNRTLNDPMLVQGTILSNDLASFNAPLFGTGSTLTLTLRAQANGGSEAFAFQNVILSQADVPPPPPSELEIFEIQGNGAASPVAGSVVITFDNVVTALASNGFFMQTPTARSDADVDTSDGIFVFTGSPPGVAVGDNVDVTGQVVEFFGFTELTSATVTPDGTGLLPPAVTFDASVPSPDPALPSCAIEFECSEGMLIEIAAGTVTGPNQRFSSDIVAEVHITAAPLRAFREPGIAFPGLAGLPVWDGNPEVFEMDPDRLGLPNAIIPAGSAFSAKGVLGFEFGGYELWPTELTFDPAPIPLGVPNRAIGEITVATLNLFRLFDDVDDPPSLDAQGGTRNDAVVSSAEYLRRRAKLALYIVDVLDAPDILAVQEAEKLEVLQDLATDIAALAPGISYSAFLEEGNDLGTIDVGFLVRSGIIVDGVTQLGKNETFIDPSDLSVDILHDRPPLLLDVRIPEDGDDFLKMAVMVLHNRSLNGIDSPSSGPRVRQKRFEQAQSIARKIEAFAKSNQQKRKKLIVLGDFNAFEFTDGFVDVVGQIKGDFNPADNLVCQTNLCDDLIKKDLTNQVERLDELDRYSFIFRGSAQAIDHALTTKQLNPCVSWVAFGRGNADAAVDLINDDSTSLRSSDHDGLVIFIDPDECEQEDDSS